MQALENTHPETNKSGVTNQPSSCYFVHNGAVINYNPDASPVATGGQEGAEQNSEI